MSFSNPSITSGKTTIVEVNEIFVPYTNIYTDKAYAEDIRSECIGRISFVDEEVDFESDFLSCIAKAPSSIVKVAVSDGILILTLIKFFLRNLLVK